jgi:hypothetical protein
MESKVLLKRLVNFSEFWHIGSMHENVGTKSWSELAEDNRALRDRILDLENQLKGVNNLCSEFGTAMMTTHYLKEIAEELKRANDFRERQATEPVAELIQLRNSMRQLLECCDAVLKNPECPFAADSFADAVAKTRNDFLL